MDIKERINGFYGKTDPLRLAEKYGSPVYVYSEKILKERCNDIKSLVKYPDFVVNYSVKANSNLELLKILRSQGVHVDAMSPGEIKVNLAAGFKPEQILYIGNNVSKGEMGYAMNQGVQISVDSISQLHMLGSVAPGNKVALRFNPGVGAGHHKKVVTGGEGSKFGIDADHVAEAKSIAKSYGLKVSGINQHIGSLFLGSDVYITAVKALLKIAEEFEDLDFVDFGGGFGIPYHKMSGQKRLNLSELGARIDAELETWVKKYGKRIMFKVEPGRYLVAECGVLLGKVHAIKVSYATKYVGTDIGFNVLMRPVLYDAYHEISVFPHDQRDEKGSEQITMVGNICESGDIIAKGRLVPKVKEGDIIEVMDAGAYGYAMSSNYNNRLRPAEVLITEDGEDKLIRRRESLDDLMRYFV